jgi:4-amino-4-deoxy-L-arabinose transferase-like glycosyltransferase
MNKLTVIALVALYGLSAWFRISSLDSLPETDGDEAWHAIQLVHMLRGEAFSIRTEHGLPLSPIHAVLELPLLLLFKPSYSLLRIPSLFTGVLAVVLIYRLGERMFDRVTGLIASCMLAVLPVAIIFARTGYESSHAPLYGVMLLWCAFEQRIVWLSLLLSLAYFVHPTNIFLLPVVLAVLSFRTLRGPMPPSREDVWVLARKMIAPTAIVAAIGVFTLLRPTTESLSATYHLGLRGSHDVGRYLSHFGRLFLGTGRTPRPAADWATWVVASVVIVAGTAIAIRRRRLDVFALFAGLIASLAGFFVVGSSDILQPGITRYGLFLVVPTVLLIAHFLSLVLIISQGAGWSALARRGQETILVAAAFAILFSMDMRRLSNQVLDAAPVAGESIWTFGADTKDTRKLSLDWVFRHMDREPRKAGEMTVLIAPDFMTRRSLQYLALPRRDLKIVEFHALGNPDQVASVMDRQIRQGAYVIMPPGHALEPAVKWLLSPYRYEAKEIKRGGNPAFMLYRPIVDPVEVAGSAPRTTR